MRSNIQHLIFGTFIFCIGIFSCTTYKPFYAKSEVDWKKANNPDSLELDYTVFVVGDAGKPETNKQEPTLKLMEKQLYQLDTTINGLDTIIKKSSNPKDAVIFTGDNIYNDGLPEPEAFDRKLKEQYIIEQMKIVKDFKGKKIFIPGNHDWKHSRSGGLATLKRQEEFVENYLDSSDVFLPSNGCAGPVEVQMNNNLVIIAVDSEWWLTRHSRSDRYEQGCSVENEEQLISQVRDILLRNKGKNIVFTQHHPLFTNGKHGGYFTFMDYMFPLTLVRDNLYIPLPIIGSIYPLMRQYGLSPQDVSNKKYQSLRTKLLNLFENEKHLVMATGHEHAIQLTRYKNMNHIISGAGSKKSALFQGNDALFGHGTKGFARLNYYKNGQCWVEFWEPVGDGDRGELVYRAPLYSLPATRAIAAQEKQISYKDSVKVMAVGEQYEASKLKQFIFGEHYRSVWATPVTIPYLDLTTFAGGLTPTQLGGGKQTTSLRFVGKNKIQYQFRTIDKDPSALLPEGLRTTFADDIVQDQISSAHPFGALAIPMMADAVGVFHTNPQLVYMPYSTMLGPYLDEVGGRAGIIEIRPDEDLSKFEDFGFTKNAVSTQTMYEKLKEDNDNSVDQESYLTARLFDMLIGDWDRHEDQWRWAEFEKKGKGEVFKPIPRDRDQVFTKFDGLIPKLISGMVPDIQTFDYEIKDPAELSIAARNLDRNLLTELTKEEWLAIAKKMQSQLTDDVIEKSVKKLPPSSYQLTGSEIIAKLKSRREKLHETAAAYYDVLAQEVTISGSDKHEFLQIVRKDETTAVKMYKIDANRKVDKVIYSREFNNSVTRELNFYLLDGKDSLSVTGKSDMPVKIRIVGGPGKDYLADASENGKTIFYDTPDNKFVTTSATRKRTSDLSWANEYLPNNFTYDKSGFGPNADIRNGKDGLMFGLSYSTKHYGFRKSPYSYDQRASLMHALRTKAWSAKYNANFYSLFAHKYDLVLDGTYDGPAYSFNFYGIGNNTTNVGDNIDFHRIRSEMGIFTAYIQRRMSDKMRFGFGPGFEFVKIVPGDVPNFVDLLPTDYANPGRFLTFKSYFRMNFTDDPLLPKTGFKMENSANFFSELGGDGDRFLRLGTVASAYATPNIKFPMTIALRLGVQTNIGDYKFYQANALGNNSYLRGFRNQRFSGRSAYFANTELRFPVSTFRTYLLTGDFGVYGFHDIGRVTSSLDTSNEWHQGYGPGVWLHLYNKLLFSVGYGFSTESRVISFRSGFRF